MWRVVYFKKDDFSFKNLTTYGIEPYIYTADTKDHLLEFMQDYSQTYIYSKVYEVKSEERKKAPEVLEPVFHAYWDFNHFYGKQFHCSRCGGGSDLKTNYCPYCGAIMDEGEEPEE